MLSKTGMEWVDNSKSTLLQLYILVDQGAITYKLAYLKDSSAAAHSVDYS